MGAILDFVCGIFATWTFICFLGGFSCIIVWPPRYAELTNYIFIFVFLLTGVLSGILAIILSLWNMGK